jgi:hypothetical protein
VKFYKLLHHLDGDLCSYNVSLRSDTDLSCLKYKTGAWTYPRLPGSLLFLFGSLAWAEMWRNGHDPDLYPIWESKVKLAVPLDIQLFRDCRLSTDGIRTADLLATKCWEKYRAGLAGVPQAYPYRDVYLATAIKLVRKVG